jgi:hypothetical protein
MQEALELQSQWEGALKRITKGRQFEELTTEEQDEWKRIGSIYNEQIEKKLVEWKNA